GRVLIEPEVDAERLLQGMWDQQDEDDRDRQQGGRERQRRPGPIESRERSHRADDIGWADLRAVAGAILDIPPSRMSTPVVPATRRSALVAHATRFDPDFGRIRPA